jgi:hypothetical protein
MGLATNIRRHPNAAKQALLIPSCTMSKLPFIFRMEVLLKDSAFTICLYIKYASSFSPGG